MVNTTSMLTSDPANADPATPIAAIAPEPAVRAITAPREAPAETPNTYGSASGLRTRVCRHTPARLSPAPATAASSTRGVRKSHTIWLVSGSSPAGSPHRCAVITSSTWPTGTCTVPTPIATAVAASSATASPATSRG